MGLRLGARQRRRRLQVRRQQRLAGTTGYFRKFDAGKHGNRSAYNKALWFFGWTFAGAGCTIVSGAIAERATFLAYALYSVILTGFVYPPVVHMMWTTGKFSAWRSGPKLFGDCGVIDFAGSGTVHMTGGVAALIAAACIGVRKGFPDALPEGQPVYQALGILILWMGWYGFNCVSTLYIDGLAQSTAVRKSNSRRPTPSTRRCAHSCVRAMAWRFTN